MSKVYSPLTPITRRQFFARLRKVGFTKAYMQLSRNSVSYEREDEIITLPKGHTQIIQVMGDVPYSGWHIAYGTKHCLGSAIPEGWDLLATVLGLVTGDIYKAAQQQALDNQPLGDE